MKGGAHCVWIKTPKQVPRALETSVDARGVGEVMVAGVICKDCQQPLDSEMINHFSTKEHKGRFVKKKQGTEYQLQGLRGSSV